MEDKRFALLIDADNIGSQYIKTIVDELTGEGIITYKRIYGDWTSPTVKPWKEVLLDYSITPMQQYAYTTGKSSTDSAMIIDAMDILYSGKVDGFCLVSSDSDFTHLAARLREAGMVVIGMGKKQTPKPFVAACSQFKYIDIIAEEQKPIEVKKTSSLKTEENNPESHEELAMPTPKDEIIQTIKRMIEENSNDEGWMLVSLLGNYLSKKYSDFDVRNYGYKKMVQLLKGFGFEIKAFNDVNNPDQTGYVAYVRNPENPLKTVKTKTDNKKKK